MKNSSTSKVPFRLFAILAGLALVVVALLWQGNHEQPDASDPSNASVPGNPPGSKINPRRAVNPGALEADRLLTAERARTDATVSRFPEKEYEHLPPPNGKAAGAPAGQAYIHVPSDGRRVAFEPNQIGEFPAVATKLNDTVGVRLSLDAVKPGVPVRVVIMDGGLFPAVGGAAQVLKAGDWGGVAFEYTTSGNIGSHRILVQAQGQRARILNFSAHDGATWPAPSTASN